MTERSRFTSQLETASSVLIILKMKRSRSSLVQASMPLVRLVLSATLTGSMYTTSTASDHSGMRSPARRSKITTQSQLLLGAKMVQRSASALCAVLSIFLKSALRSADIRESSNLPTCHCLKFW